MWASIIGDIAGSVYEFLGCKRADVDLSSPGAEVTDDSILSIATASVLLKGGWLSTSVGLPRDE